jgi:glyoxylase-like metal-dependent hydrolase (beta-lactamase superfamily II)
MRSRVAVASVVALLLVVAYVRAQQFGNQPAKLNIVKVKDDLFVIHNDFVPGNTTALVTDEGVVIVDDKFEQDAPNILSLLKTVTNQPVKYVVNTHHHGDHSGGNARMQMAGAQLIASEQARRYMVDAKQPGQPGVTFVDRALIHLGGKAVELYYFGRAHTGGDVFAYFPADRVLAAGDAFTFRRRDAAAGRLSERRQCEGLDGDARSRAAARLRHRRAWPRRRHDQGRVAEIPRQHARDADTACTRC